jgi:predicted alpha/beta-fold hydrolase
MGGISLLRGTKLSQSIKKDLITFGFLVHLVKEKGFIYDFKSLDQVQTIWQFDECFTAPMYGYQSATDYYKANSSKAFLEFIRLPTLIVSAKNDVMLSESCFPTSAIVGNQLVKLNYTEKGGHVGFYDGFKTYIDKHIIDLFLKNENILL